MERVYADLIKKGLKTIDNIPLKLRDKVLRLLGENENE